MAYNKRQRDAQEESNKKNKTENCENKKLWEVLLNSKYDFNSQYMSATKTANYLLEDPIIDWLNLYYKKTLTQSEIQQFEEEYNKNMKYMKFYFDGGNIFEDKIMDFLQAKFLSNFLKINSDGAKGANKNNFEKTKSALYSGVPILAQAVLFNDINKTYGVADLLVRSDYINKIMVNKILTQEEEKIKAPKLNGNYHYIVIDIKYSLLHFSTKNNTLLKSGRIPAYKGQLAIYNCALGLLQGYFPEKAYILGKGWKRNKTLNREKIIEENYDCFDDLGVIDYVNQDNNYIEKTAEAIEWYTNLMNNGQKWNLLKPENKNMYPNMCNDDLLWASVKKKIANEIKEPTLIMNVGIKEREELHKREIYDYEDKDCHAQNMGIKEANEISDRINTLLMKDQQFDVYPRKMANNDKKWQITSPVDFYFDFETVNEDLVRQEINIRNTRAVSAMIFQIGIGWCENNTWQYKSFCIDKVSEEDEKNMVNEFFEFIITKSKELDKTKKYYPRLFHWTQAEITNLKDINKRQNNIYAKFLDESEIYYVDMYNVFIKEKIYIKDALNYKLKTVGKALYKLGKINISWPDTDIVNGQIAMLEAVEYYRNKQNKKIMDDIIAYNEIDCKMIYEIVSFFRN